MKIAYCLPAQNWIDEMRGGEPKDAAHIQQRYIAEGLQARSHSITYIAPRDGECMLYAQNSDALTVAPQTWTAGAWFTLLSKIVWRIQQIFGVPYLNVFSNMRQEDASLQILPGHDLAFERNSLYNIGVARACSKLGIPYVIFFDADQIAELDFLGRPLRGLLRRRAQNLLRENLNIAARIICVSETAKKHLMTRWDLSGEKIVVMPNAVDIHRFRPDPNLRRQVRASLSLTTQTVLIFVGSFYKWHDIATLLKAFSLVLRSTPQAILVLVGDGAERERMMEYADKLGVAQRVRFTGHVNHNEVAGYINAADIGVVPVPTMKQEMWLSPMKLFEYMASGNAILASNAGQLSEWIADGQNGLLVPPGDVSAMADGIERLIGDPDLRRRLGQNARTQAVQKHSWERYLSDLEHVYFSVLEKGMH